MPARSFSAHKLGGRIRSRQAPDRWPRGRESAQPAREPRDRDPSQDTAVYTCHCGMVFEAPVNTTVDCPHCGGQQAW